jgi:hypothetical protein
MRSIIKPFFLCLFVGFSVGALAQQVPVLEREVTISANNESAADILARVAIITGIKFSYSPSLIPAEKRISLNVQHKSVRSLLYIMFEETVQFKAKGNFIILTAKPKTITRVVPQEIVVSGYIYDDKGEPIALASILNKGEQMSAVTNQYGYYTIKVPSDKLPMRFEVKKRDYMDTVVKIAARKIQTDIVMQNVKKETLVPEISYDTLTLEADTVNDDLHTIQLDSGKTKKGVIKDLERWLLSDETKANIRNIGDTIFSAVQFSVIPGISTNKLLAGNTVENVSISLLVGYNKGLKIGALAGLANIVAGNAAYVLAAGVLNVVKDTMIGGELSGVLNINSGYTKGAQLSGFGNINKGNLEGVQAAGFFNVLDGDLDGAQLSGFVNANQGNLRGAQVAGFVNVAHGNIVGAQIAGFVNATEGNIAGTQLAGFVNSNKGDMIGTQVAGCANLVHGNLTSGQISGLVNFTSGKVEGTQISSLFNYAKRLSGIQIGLINVSDTCEGIPIGLLSFCNRGYHKIEVFADDMLQTNLAFRLGVQKFHNIFNVGVDLTNRISGLWNFGYGIGSYYDINEKWKFGFELLTQSVLKQDQINSATQINSCYVGVERQFGRKINIGIAPAYHLAYHRTSDTEISKAIIPYSFYNSNTISMWAGGKITIKFL